MEIKHTCILDTKFCVGCGHTKGKSVVTRGEAYARIKAACDARDEGQDIFILARTDALILGWEEAITRGLEFKRMGVDAVFVEALPDRAAMTQCVKELDMPVFANSESPFPGTCVVNLLTYGNSYRRRTDREPVGKGHCRAGLLRGSLSVDSCRCSLEECS